jgi:hypothetical protein
MTSDQWVQEEEQIASCSSSSDSFPQSHLFFPEDCNQHIDQVENLELITTTIWSHESHSQQTKEMLRGARRKKKPTSEW